MAGIKDFDAQYARALTLVKTDAGLGALLGAKSTPTFFINGHVIAGIAAGPLLRSGHPAGALAIARAALTAVNAATAEPSGMTDARPAGVTGALGIRLRCLPRFA